MTRVVAMFGGYKDWTMATLSIENLPDDLNQRLKEQAAIQNCSIRELALGAIQRELERLEFQERLQELPLTDSGEIDGATLIRQERALRDLELGASPEQALRDLELRR